jgi:type I restriction enzyme R subunit
MIKQFTESVVEEAALEWLSEIGYTISPGTEISPNGQSPERSTYDQVILVDRLRSALFSINAGILPSSVDEAIRKITIQQSPNPLANNHIFHKMLTDGITVEVSSKNGEIMYEQVWLIDFYNPGNNDWLAVNQLTIIENQERHPDIIVYLNGLPIAVIELKNTGDEDATIRRAFDQLQTYKKDIPSLFITNEFLVVSDGTEARIGSLSANWERFMPWRTIEGEKLAPEGVPQLETLLKGVFDKRWFLDLIRYFIVFDVEETEITKKIAAYHQYYGVNKAVGSTIKASSADGDKRVGVIWHTQGSGKSLTMAFYSGKIIQHEVMANPTVVVLTDRNDLDNQLYDEFSRSCELTRQLPVQAESRKQLQDLLRVASGGVIFTTIQKFAPEKDEKYPILSKRRNVVVIADEAHRSQYEFIHGFARHMRDGLPNASFIAFTGTPIELTDRNTPAVFGDYIDIYDIQRAVEDGFTVPIYFEARLAKLSLKEDEWPKLDEKFEEITEEQELRTRERLKSKWARLEAVVGTDKRIRQVAQDIVLHFEERTKVLEGKGMIVCMSRRICVDLYDAIIKIRPEWHDKNDDKGSIKVVMTGSASDPEKLQPHIRNKKRRESIKNRLKDPNGPLKLVIVRDMWLTGFDAPVVHTMYIDKPIQGHSLMQAIARVNRVFKNKPGGLIVDYIGIGSFLKKALANYVRTDRKENVIPQEDAVSLMLDKYDRCKAMFSNFDYSKFFSGNATEQTAIIPAAMNYILSQEDGKNRFVKAVMDLSKAFALSVPHDKALEIRDDVGFFQVIRAQIVKYTQTTGRPSEEVDSAIRQIVSEAIGSQGIVDIFDTLGLEKPEVSPLLSDRFLNGLKDMQQKNLALELLRKLINDELKVRIRKNLVQSKMFSDMLEQSIRKYQNRTIEAAQVINNLIDLAKEMREANRRGEQLNLTDDELAFYDALEVNDSAVKVLGDKTLRQIAIDLVNTIRNNITIDWTVKESVRAKMRAAVRRLLRKYGYPPEKQEKTTETVLEQAELLTRDGTREVILERIVDKVNQKPIAERIRERENSSVELKSSFRYDTKLKQSNPKLLEQIIAKTIAAFMNSEGGTLFIGVDDQGNVLGLEDDYKTLKKQNSDGFEIEIRQSIEKYTKNKIANESFKLKFHLTDGKEICEVTVSPGPEPIVIYDEGKQQEFYVRIGNSSKPYTWDEFYEYSKRRFK